MKPNTATLGLSELQLVLATLHAHDGRMRLDDLAVRCRMSRDQLIQAVARLQLVHGSDETYGYVDIDIDEDGWVDLGPNLDQGLGRRPLPLTPGEVAALSAAVRALAEGPAVAMAQEARGILDKIVALAGAPVREALGRIDARIAVDTELGVSDPVWSVVLKALQAHQELEIEYLTASRDELTHRTVRPWAIVGREGYWYLHAFCLARGDGRMFRLDRIVSVHNTGEAFDPPAPEATLPSVSDEHVTERQRPDIQIRFAATVADWVRERHPDRVTHVEPGGTIVVSIPWQSRTFLAGWVLSFAGQAVVIAPPDMRRLVRDRLHAAFPEAVDCAPAERSAH